MNPNQQFNALFEQYVFKVANEIIGEAAPVQQKSLIDLLLSIDSGASVYSPGQQTAPVDEPCVALKKHPEKSRRPPVDKRIADRQLRRGILQLSIEQNQRQITCAIACIGTLDELIAQAESTLLNEIVKNRIIARYQRAIDIYSSQLNRLNDFNHTLSHSVSQLA